MATATATFAEDYPTHSVRLLVGYATGGSPDIVARTIAQQLSEILKQPFVVENKPGASGTIAAAQTAKAAPDGYTIYIADVAQFGITPFMYKDLPFDPKTAFTPVALATGVPLALVANAKTGFKTLADLVRYAKANPGKLNYGSVGIGSAHHIAVEVLKHDAGIDMVHVPFKGASQYIPALLANDVQVALSGFTGSAPYVRTGQLNILGVTSAVRFPGAPDVPTIGETYRGYEFAPALGVMAPSGTPPEVVAKLSGAIKTALEVPQVKERLISLGLIPSWLSSRDYAEYMRRDMERYERAIQDLHIQLN